MLAFDLLRVALARAVNLRLQLPRVGAPMICIILCDPKRLQQPFQLQKHLILATPKDIGKDGPREVINRVPKPPLVLFLADKRPHLIHLGFASTLDTHGDLVALPSAQQGRVHRLQNRFFFLSSLSTVSGLIRSTRAVSRTPLEFRLLSMIVRFTSGTYPRLR